MDSIFFKWANPDLFLFIFVLFPFQSVWPDGYITHSIIGHLQQWTFSQSRKNGQSRFKILPNMKETVQKLPKILKCSPKWRNFDKSGHTDPSFPELKCFRGFFILERRLQIILNLLTLHLRTPIPPSPLWQLLNFSHLTGSRELQLPKQCDQTLE